MPKRKSNKLQKGGSLSSEERNVLENFYNELLSLPSVTDPSFSQPQGDVSLFTTKAGNRECGDLIISVDPICHNPTLPPYEFHVEPDTLITFDASATLFPDTCDEPFAWDWTQIVGDGVTLSEYEEAITTFTSPSEPTGGNPLEFSLTIWDENLNTHTTDSVTIHVVSPEECILTWDGYSYWRGDVNRDVSVDVLDVVVIVGDILSVSNDPSDYGGIENDWISPSFTCHGGYELNCSDGGSFLDGYCPRGEFPVIECYGEGTVSEIEFPSIYIQGGMVRNYIGFTLPPRDELVCAGEFNPGDSDEFCLTAEEGDSCGAGGICKEYDLGRTLNESFFENNPDEGDTVIQEFTDQDTIYTDYYRNDIDRVTGQSSYNATFGTWMGAALKNLRSNRGYHIFTQNSGWIKWQIV